MPWQKLPQQHNEPDTQWRCDSCLAGVVFNSLSGRYFIGDQDGSVQVAREMPVRREKR
jgi:hypothetical protein